MKNKSDNSKFISILHKITPLRGLNKSLRRGFSLLLATCILLPLVCLIIPGTNVEASTPPYEQTTLSFTLNKNYGLGPLGMYNERYCIEWPYSDPNLDYGDYISGLVDTNTNRTHSSWDRDWYHDWTPNGNYNDSDTVQGFFRLYGPESGVGGGNNMQLAASDYSSTSYELEPNTKYTVRITYKIPNISPNTLDEQNPVAKDQLGLWRGEDTNNTTIGKTWIHGWQRTVELKDPNLWTIAECNFETLSQSDLDTNGSHLFVTSAVGAITDIDEIVIIKYLNEDTQQYPQKTITFNTPGKGWYSHSDFAANVSHLDSYVSDPEDQTNHFVRIQSPNATNVNFELLDDNNNDIILKPETQYNVAVRFRKFESDNNAALNFMFADGSATTANVSTNRSKLEIYPEFTIGTAKGGSVANTATYYSIALPDNEWITRSFTFTTKAENDTDFRPKLCVLARYGVCKFDIDEITLTEVPPSFTASLSDTANHITFDVSKGDVIIKDTYSGFDSAGNLLTGNHSDAKVYIITGATTEHKVEINSSPVVAGVQQLNNVVVLLENVKIDHKYGLGDATKENWNVDSTLNFNGAGIKVDGQGNTAIVLKDDTDNLLNGSPVKPGLEKTGLSNGLMLITCETGYDYFRYSNTEYDESRLNLATFFSETHNCETDGCGHLTAEGGNGTGKSNSWIYYTAAGIGTGYALGGGVTDTTSTPSGSNALDNLTIMGGNILGIGGVEQYSTVGGAGIGTGAVNSTKPVTVGGTITRFYIIGGNVEGQRGGLSPACIGGGFRSGFVDLSVYGGKITATTTFNTNAFEDDERFGARGPGLGVGGGGIGSGSNSEALVKIFGGDITASSGAGAAIGGGAGGNGSQGNGSASAATVIIRGGNINATTTSVGAAIGAGGSCVTRSAVDGNNGDDGVAVIGRGGDGTVTISGGTIYAKSEGGADIGGGGTRSTHNTEGLGGSAAVIISGGVIIADNGGIGGGKANRANGGSATIEVSGGTIRSTAIGAGRSDSFGYNTATIYINGGSVNSMMTRQPTISSANDTNVYRTMVTLYNVHDRMINQPVTKLDITAVSNGKTDIDVSYYGIHDVYSDDNAMLFLWLPDNQNVTSAQLDTFHTDDNGNTVHDDYIGEVLTAQSGVLKYETAKNFFNVHFPYDDRYTLYSDEDCTIPISGIWTAYLGESIKFYAQANTYSDNNYYQLTAYQSDDDTRAMEEIALSIYKGNGKYEYQIQVLSDTTVAIKTQKDKSDTPRISVDLSLNSAYVNANSVVFGGYTLENYNGDFFLTSAGLPTDNTLEIGKDVGVKNIYASYITADNKAKTPITINSGSTINFTYSDYDNSISTSAAGVSPFYVDTNAVLNISFDDRDFMLLKANNGVPLIDGNGIINIKRDSWTAFLRMENGTKLTPGVKPATDEIVAEYYTYTGPPARYEGDNPAEIGALPYIVKLTNDVTLNNFQQTLLENVWPVYDTTFTTDTLYTATGVKFIYPDGITGNYKLSYTAYTNGDIQLESGKQLHCELAGEHTIAKIILTYYDANEGIVKTEELQEGSDLTADYCIKPINSGDKNLLVISSTKCNGNLYILLANEHGVGYFSANYTNIYDATEHIFPEIQYYTSENIADITVNYSTDGGSTWSTTVPTMTNVGTNTVNWQIKSGATVLASGSNTFEITKAQNRWFVSLTCPSVLLEESIIPHAIPLFGNAGDIVYTYEGTRRVNEVESSYGPTTVPPTEIGSYTVRASLAGNDNYYDLESDEVQFVIDPTAIYYANDIILDRQGEGMTSNPNIEVPVNGALTLYTTLPYNPQVANGKYLYYEFSYHLPKGTKLTVLDLCKSHLDTDPNYFYFEIDDSSLTKTKFRSDDFYQMGTNEKGLFELGSTTDRRVITLQLIVDFPDDLKEKQFDKLTIELLHENTQKLTMEPLNATITAPISVDGDLSLASSTTSVAGGFTIDATVTNTPDNNSTFIVSILDSSGNKVAAPTGTVFTVDNVEPSYIKGTSVIFNNISIGTHTIKVVNDNTNLSGLWTTGHKIMVQLCPLPSSDSFPAVQETSWDETNIGTMGDPDNLDINVTWGNSNQDPYYNVTVGSTEKDLVFRINTIQQTGNIECQIYRKTKALTDNYEKVDFRIDINPSGWTETGVTGYIRGAHVYLPANAQIGTYRAKFTYGDNIFYFNFMVR